MSGEWAGARWATGQSSMQAQSSIASHAATSHTLAACISRRRDALERIRQLQSSLCNIIASPYASAMPCHAMSGIAAVLTHGNSAGGQGGAEATGRAGRKGSSNSCSVSGHASDVAAERRREEDRGEGDEWHGGDAVVAALRHEVAEARQAVAVVRAERAELQRRCDEQQEELRSLHEAALHVTQEASSAHHQGVAVHSATGPSCCESYCMSPTLVQAAGDLVRSVPLHMPGLLPPSLRLTEAAASNSDVPCDDVSSLEPGSAQTGTASRRQQLLCDALRCINEQVAQGLAAECDERVGHADEGAEATRIDMDKLLEVQLAHCKTLQAITRKLERVQTMQRMARVGHQDVLEWVHCGGGGGGRDMPGVSRDAPCLAPTTVLADTAATLGHDSVPAAAALQVSGSRMAVCDAEDMCTLLRDMRDLYHLLVATLGGTAAGREARDALEAAVARTCHDGDTGDGECMMSEARTLLAAMQAACHAHAFREQADNRSEREGATMGAEEREVDGQAAAVNGDCIARCAEAPCQPDEAAATDMTVAEEMGEVASAGTSHDRDASSLPPADLSTLSEDRRVAMGEGQAGDEAALRAALRHAQQSVKRMSFERAGLRRKLEQRGAAMTALEGRLAELQREHDILAAQLHSLRAERDSATAVSAASAAACATTTPAAHAAVMLSLSPEKPTDAHDDDNDTTHSAEQPQQHAEDDDEDWTCPLIDFAHLERDQPGQLYPAAAPLTSWVRLAQAEPLEAVVKGWEARDQFRFHAVGALYHVGLTLACDCGLLSACGGSSSDDGGNGDERMLVWQRFLLQLQHVADATCAPHSVDSYGAMATADCAQFFYALAVRAGLLADESMSVKLCVVLLALCQHVGLPSAQTSAPCPGRRVRRQWRLLESMARHLHDGDDTMTGFFASLIHGTTSEDSAVCSLLRRTLSVDYERAAGVSEAWLQRCCDVLLPSSAARLPTLLQLLLCLAQYATLFRPSFDVDCEADKALSCLCGADDDEAAMDKSSANGDRDNDTEMKSDVQAASSKADASQTAHAATASTATSVTRDSNEHWQARLLDELDRKVLPLTLLVARALDEPALAATPFRHRTTLYEICNRKSANRTEQTLSPGETVQERLASPTRLRELMHRFLKSGQKDAAQAADDESATTVSAAAQVEQARPLFARLLTELGMGQA